MTRAFTKAGRAVAATALLLLAACQQGTSPAPEYRPGEAGTVDHALCLLGFTGLPLREVVTGHHLVEASINGQTASFVLDTGANVTVIDESQADAFDLADSGAVGAMGNALPQAAGQARQVAIESLAIDGVEIRQSRIVRADLGQLLTTLAQLSGEDVAGLIGQDVLNEHRAVIDVARPILYLIEADRDPAPVPADQCRDDQQEPVA